MDEKERKKENEGEPGNTNVIWDDNMGHIRN